MNDFKDNFGEFNFDQKKVGKYIIIGVVSLIALVMFLKSWQDVDPG